MNSPTDQTLELIRKVYQDARGDLAKASNTITTATGLTAYDLQAPAKNLYPVNTPIRNTLPRVAGVGPATNWRQITAIIGSGYDSSGWVAEGQRTGAMSITAASKSASYKTLGEEEALTYEAISAGRTFEDLQATSVVRLLQKLMLKEENAVMGGNTSVALGTPTAPTTATATTGGTIAAATYNVIVAALSFEGYRNSSAAGGVATSQVITGQDGLTYTLNGGSSMKSNATSQVTTGATSTISATVPVVSGAVAYAWYVGTAGNEKLEAITTINSVLLTALLGTGQNASAITADKSQNALGFDGLLYSAFASGSGAYIKSLATGTPGTGTGLTASGRGSVVEIDSMFKVMWDTYQVSPSVLYVNSQELNNINNKVLGSGGSPLVRFNLDALNQNSPSVVAGQVVGSYFNPFSTSGGYLIPVRIHPTLPAGTILGLTESLPIQYQSPNVPNVAELRVRQDFYEIDWPLVTRSRQVGTYVEEVLAVYAPFTIGIINNIANA
jgi:hypothetical protein